MSGTEIELPETMHIGGESTEEQPSGERQPTPRELTMQAIAERAEAARQREMEQARVYDEDARAAGLTYPEDEPEAAPEPPPVAAAPTHQPDPHPAPAPAPAPAAPQLRTVNVDGQQWQVTEEQFTHLANLGMLANVALHQAGSAPAAPQPEPPKSLVDAERAREVVKQIQYGGEDAAVPALVTFVEDVLKRVPQGPQIDPNAIVTRAVQEARAQAQLAADQAVIKAEYPEIFADPQRTMLARLNVEAIRARNTQQGRYMNDLDIYREAGNAVYDALGKPRPGSETTTSPALQAVPSPREGVLERKRAAPRATQVVDRRAPTPETPRPPTGSEIVQKMRASRFQTAY